MLSWTRAAPAVSGVTENFRAAPGNSVWQTVHV